jgi:murein DD-endopeptidase MepM/ murein hydrolase activator NlpD
MNDFDPSDGPSAFELLGLGQPDLPPPGPVAPPVQQDAGTPMSRRQTREAEARRSEGFSVPQAGPPPVHAPPTPVPTLTPRLPARKIVVIRPAIKKRHAPSALLSFGAMLFAGALLVGVSVPASLFAPDAAAETDSTADKIVAGQSLKVASNTTGGDTSRKSFTVTSYAELLRQRYGNRSYSYTVGVGAVQWPFPYAVPISSGFGVRAAPCRGCSTFHKGIDLLGGNGAPVYAIADGVVSLADWTPYGLGYEVTIEHEIKGQHITSAYGHMKANSSPLKVGQTVKVGDFIGLVGMTGEATAPHLHLEIHVDEVAIDPFPWMKAHAAA